MADQERRVAAGVRGKQFFEETWSQGDFWSLETSSFEQQNYRRQLELIADRRYSSALEIGCGAGVFTRLLMPICDHIDALDVSEAAIARALANTGPEFAHRISYDVENIMDHKFSQSDAWDLIVFSETICYLGWLYPFFDVAWLAIQLFEATKPGGRLLMKNTLGMEGDYLLLPAIIRTYEDMFVNVGFELERRELLTGEKEGVPVRATCSVFLKAERS